MPPSYIAPPKSKGAASGVSGEYTKLSLVGKGSFGSVWLVRHTQKGGETLIMKEVAIKGLAQSEIRATKQETAVLKHVNHSNIIGYHTTFEADGFVNIVMEYASGGDLGRLITKRVKEKGPRFTESDIKRYATQLGSALEYLHNDVKLLHRDIKPKNVFLSGSGDVRLGDFGLSKVLSKADGTAEAQVGTPLYMSPELAAGQPYDRGADVWAFGCTLFECMSFKPPWSELCTPDGALDGGMKALANSLRNSSLDVMALRSHYSEDLCEKLKQLLAKRRADRLPLASLIEQLTEAPKHPASWGLSAAAQAALEAANVPTPPPPSKKQTSKGKLEDCDVDADDGAAKGIELHAAAGVLQRSFRTAVHRKQVNMRAPGEESIGMGAAQPQSAAPHPQPSRRGSYGGLSEQLKIAPPRPGSTAGGGAHAKKPALKPSRVGALKPALKATSSATFVGPSPSGRVPSGRAPSLRAMSQRADAKPKPPPKKTGLKPTRVRDGLG